MNATSVSIRAGLRLGMILAAVIPMVSCFRPAEGPEVVITVTGTVNGVRDDFRIFSATRSVPKGTPYTLVFTFDDTKGQPMPGPCLLSGSGITGGGQLSPAIA